jgi:PAS domain S-box-containing protein
VPCCSWTCLPDRPPILLNVAGPKSHFDEQLLRFASIIESSDDAIITNSLDGIITTWNKSAERLLGYTAEEVIGKPITILIPLERRDEERTILEGIRRGVRIEHYETVRQRKDGGLIDISPTVSPVKNTQGGIIGASKIARDITERKRSDEHIVVLAREAEHRTKNILATVQAIVSLSHSDTPNDGFKSAIEGRVKALAQIHNLFVETRWTGQVRGLLDIFTWAASFDGCFWRPTWVSYS